MEYACRRIASLRTNVVVIVPDESLRLRALCKTDCHIPQHQPTHPATRKLTRRAILADDLRDFGQDLVLSKV